MLYHDHVNIWHLLCWYWNGSYCLILDPRLYTCIRLKAKFQSFLSNMERDDKVIWRWNAQLLTGVHFKTNTNIAYSPHVSMVTALVVRVKGSACWLPRAKGHRTWKWLSKLYGQVSKLNVCITCENQYIQHIMRHFSFKYILFHVFWNCDW